MSDDPYDPVEVDLREMQLRDKVQELEGMLHRVIVAVKTDVPITELASAITEAERMLEGKKRV